jgi:hypothetical protein
LNKNNIYQELYDIYQKDPIFFIQHSLGVYTWSKMQEIMESVRDNKRTAVRASHGTSKTFTAANAAVWFFNVFPESKIITTAPTGHQVKDLLWTEIGRLYRQSKIKLDGECQTLAIRTDLSEHYAIGFSTDKPTKAEGFHAPQLLFILDEAKGISQWLWDAVRGAMTGGHARMLVISTTDGVQIGEQFYKCFEDDKYNQWNKIHIDCRDTPFFTGEKFKGVEIINNDIFNFRRIEINPEKLKDKIQIATPEYEDECIKEWGIDSILYKTKARGDIVKDVIDTIISLEKIYKMFGNYDSFDKEKPLESGFDEVGVDVARKGTDDSCFYMRRNLVVRKKLVLRIIDTQLLCDELEKFLDFNKTIKIKIDDTGIGGAVTDTMKRRGYENVIPVNFNQVAMDSEKYTDAISEMWFETEKIIQNIICQKLDDRLMVELANRKRKLITKKGQRQVESKDDYKSRGFKSPDEADAFLLSFYDIKDSKGSTYFFNF